jgi:hypothetical protein
MAKRSIPSLIIERAEDTGNFYFLSVLEFRRENYLVVIDNITNDEIGAYVLDYAQQEGMNLKDFLTLVTQWFYRSSGGIDYPLSFEFSRIGIASRTNLIHKTFELAHVTRVIGKDFKFDLSSPPKVRRRQVNKIPAGFEIKIRQLTQPIALPNQQPRPT